MKRFYFLEKIAVLIVLLVFIAGTGCKDSSGNKSDSDSSGLKNGDSVNSDSDQSHIRGSEKENSTNDIMETTDGEGQEGDSSSGENADGDPKTDKEKVSDDDSKPSDKNPDGMGPGTANEYESDSKNADSISVSGDGKLTLDHGATKLTHLWVANSNDGTVSKIDTETVKEVARYHVGSVMGSNPSRTSVDLAGNVFVGGRDAPTSITKIAGTLEQCEDRNGDGKIQTSSGPTDILPRGADGWSTDECVLWVQDNFSGQCEGIRGVAATAETDDEKGEMFRYTGHVWVGCLSTNTAYKLNGETGEEMAAFETGSCGPYGFVLDTKKRVWISCGGFMEIAEFDTQKPKEGIHSTNEQDVYGIAIDDRGNIWTASLGGIISRYDPNTEKTESLVVEDTSSSYPGGAGEKEKDSDVSHVLEVELHGEQ